jgi:hypothetical protein
MSGVIILAVPFVVNELIWYSNGIHFSTMRHQSSSDDTAVTQDVAFPLMRRE